MNARIIQATAFLLFTLAIAPFAAADDIVWDNSTGDAAWSNPSNWSPNTEPNGDDFAIFPFGFPNGDTTVKLTATRFADALYFFDNYTLANPLAIMDTAVLYFGESWGIIYVDPGKSAQINVQLKNSTGQISKIGSGAVILNRDTKLERIYVADGEVAISRRATCNHFDIAVSSGTNGQITFSGLSAEGVLMDGAGFFPPLPEVILGAGTATLNITNGARLDTFIGDFTIGLGAIQVSQLSISAGRALS